MPVDTSFRRIMAPMAPEEFFTAFWDRRAVHIPGDADKVAEIFTWEEFNRLLGMTKLWSERTMKIVLDGREVDLADIARPGHGREGYPANLVRPDAVLGLLGRGATVILDVIETLSPGVAAVAASLQNATGGVAVCNAYCSWQAHQGFMTHFDTTDVFALHIEGAKVWRIFEGRADHPIDKQGFDYGSFDQDHHARARGRLLEEIEMRPGDVLYLPRGQYHEALATSEASLHLSFGIGLPTGLDVISRLLQSLPDESLFRGHLPHFDRPQAHRERLLAIADRMHAILGDPGLSDQIRDWQRERSLDERNGQFDLPSRDPRHELRVRSMGVGIDTTGATPVVRMPGGELALEPPEMDAARWILDHDFVEAADLVRRFPDLGPEGVGRLLDRLRAASVLDPVGDA